MNLVDIPVAALYSGLMNNPELDRYVKLSGGPKDAYKTLGCSYDQLCKMRRGDRAVTPKYAKIIIDHYPELSIMKLLYGNQA